MSSTINGTIADAQGAVRENVAVSFHPRFGPKFNPARFVTYAPAIAGTDENGDFSVLLAVGRFEVAIEADVVFIRVPKDGQTYNFEDLVED